MKKSSVTLSLLLFFGVIFGQQSDDINKLVPSPNAANLIKDYQVGIDKYSGSITTTIPIYSYSGNGFQIPVNLAYAGGNGIKADELPTWVGLGWNLKVGGQITRLVKNQPDEYRSLITHTSIFGGTVIANKTINSNDVSYLSNYSLLDQAGWSQISFLNSLNTNSPYFTSSGNSSISNANPLKDLEPDEFNFNINGITGRFYLDHTGIWIVVTDNPGVTFTVTPTIKTSINVNNGKIIPRAIVEFIIQSSDGSKYYFGENQATNPKNIEYNYGGFWSRNNNYTGPYTEIMPSTWHLTKIVDLLNQETTFTYKKMGYQSSKFLSYWGIYPNGGVTGSVPSPRSMEKTLVDAWYLEKITGNDNVEIRFESENSNQLGSNENVESDGIYFSDINAPLPYSVQTEKNSYPKLTAVKVYQNSNLVKTFQFQYIENINQRLKLEYFKENDLNTSTTSEYKFSYTPVQIPGYGSGKYDHWGFFNAANFFQLNPGPYTYALLSSSYSQSRSPDYNAGRGELLEKILLPTKGEIDFIYEARKYSKVAKTWPFTVDDEGIDKIAGGVRIHKIIKRDKPGLVAEEVEYIYERLGSSLTSGILTSPIPNYIVGDANAFSFRAAGYNPYNDRGAIVVYPFVKEKSTTNGYKLYEYESFENASNDQTAILEIPTGQHSNFNINSYNNKRFMRGLLKKEMIYSNNSQLLKETIINYIQPSPVRKLRNVHFLPYIRWTDQIYRAAAYETDLISNFTALTTIKDYSNNSMLSEMSIANTYDEFNNVVLERTITGSNSVFTKKIKYPFDVSYNNSGSDYKALGLQHLKTLGIKNFPIESIVTRANNTTPITNEKVVEGTVYVYNSNLPHLKEIYKFESTEAVPINNFSISGISGSNFNMDSRYLRSVNFLDYDNKGNILTANNEQGIKYTYLWGYNKKYIVAKILNADFATVNALVSQSILDNPANDLALRNHLAVLRTIPNTQVTIMTYKPLVGVSSETTPQGRTTYYEYDGLNRLSFIRDHDNKILKRICYNFSGQPENCTTACTSVDPDWQNTVANLRCQSENGVYTGYQERQQMDMNPCSQTQGDTKWVIEGYNPTICSTSLGCNTSNCIGDNKKCVNGDCETGELKIISTRRVKVAGEPDENGMITWWWQYYCTSAYCFSDGTYVGAYEYPTSGFCTVQICN